MSVYFDHNATTPVDPPVAEEVKRVLLEAPGNPASPHAEGRKARAELARARETLARRVGADPEEIVITSGGTESDNLAIWGAADALRDRGRHFVTTVVEHPAVLEAMDRLEAEGAEITRLPVDADGRVGPDEFSAALREDTVLASVMLANNETGAIFPIRRLADAARDRGILFHTDAVQAIGKIPVDVSDLGVDLLAAGAHKLCGPRGIGFLYVRKGTRLSPILSGGHQESGLRPGTGLTALAAGFAMAIDRAVGGLAERMEHVARLTESLLAGIREAVPDVRMNGPAEGRLPNTLNLTVPGVGGEALMIALDREGICIATGSACASGSALPSHVLTAMGVPLEDVSSSIRVSLGHDSTEEDANRFLEVFPEIVSRLRAVSGRA